EANELLSRANADLEQFAYSASHDLQEPLRMVSAFSELLRRQYGSQLTGEGIEYIGYLVEGATRMEQLLGDLRAYTQASTFAQGLTEDVDANEALSHALGNLKSAIEGCDAKVTHEVLPKVSIHQFQLEQLFQNLIGNAIRYRSEAVPEVHIFAERSGDMWTFAARDNGMGINPKYKEQIFGIFKRLHSKAELPGTGMGLAICERIVQRAGGRIWVESELGRGSTFFFTLPAAKFDG
ncbi:MAG: ATP-binding protein, partial [Chloroflexia bacterium]